ncbi:hypothetical protein L6452_37134 [Arctium lappa]|uniref:Uncharacterized protein n=1 Tax=Arctium lappa TaxID=4217 RepID=A0ACB8Y2V8_ARCLA|nr:hypothetical protein L6452_37134 [Arctium lappa]
MKVVSSTYHQKIKFPTPWGSPAIDDYRLEEVVLAQDKPNIIVFIPSSLDPAIKKSLISFLQEHADCFAWTHEDMGAFGLQTGHKGHHYLSPPLPPLAATSSHRQPPSATSTYFSSITTSSTTSTTIGHPHHHYHRRPPPLTPIITPYSRHHHQRTPVATNNHRRPLSPLPPILQQLPPPPPQPPPIATSTITTTHCRRNHRHLPPTTVARRQPSSDFFELLSIISDSSFKFSTIVFFCPIPSRLIMSAYQMLHHGRLLGLQPDLDAS